jgi:hypothetical protein
MNATFTQTNPATEVLSLEQPVRDLAEIELCLIGGGEVIYVGN